MALPGDGWGPGMVRVGAKRVARARREESSRLGADEHLELEMPRNFKAAGDDPRTGTLSGRDTQQRGNAVRKSGDRLRVGMLCSTAHSARSGSATGLIGQGHPLRGVKALGGRSGDLFRNCIFGPSRKM